MERVLLIGVARSSVERWKKIDSLEELASLTQTAGGTVVEKILQVKKDLNPATLLGKGKIEEIRQLCHKHQIDLLIFDDPLTPSQMRNISEATKVRVIDRTMLILDIFAQHAKTAEAKTQVELAQLEYRRTNLIGLGTELSRLGGGIGTRGPGEKKLEIDRRRIKDRIDTLYRQLLRIDKERAVQRKKRQPFFKISLVGYTNAGKSSVMNRLTGAQVKVAPYMFATLDPNTKAFNLTKRLKVFITDTVGFIRNLPHELIASFRATLSETKEADLILHIVDASEENIEEKIQVVDNTLKEIGCQNNSILMVFNKIDRIFEPKIIRRLKDKYPQSVFVSALTGEGFEKLKATIIEFMKSQLITRRLTISLKRGDLISKIYETCEVVRRIDKDEKATFTIRGYKPDLLKLSKEIEKSLATR
ncbi:MAG: GTPase HflX [candidate division WOR-3 bacterium]|nr:GTPase HflX [candidate division WOR-3 bacterium]